MCRNDVEIEAAGLDDVGWPADSPSWLPVRPVAHPAMGPKAFGYSPGLAQQVKRSNAEILHLHALWMYPSVLADHWGRRQKRPYIVTPNGMLEPWALANSAWKKKMAGVLYERRMLAGASCLQANTVKEHDDFRAYGLKNPIAIIPNGVDLPEEALELSKSLKVEGLKVGEYEESKSLKVEGLKVEESASQKVEGRNLEGRTSESGCGILPQAFTNSNVEGQSPEGPKILLFLGRLHPKKGLVNALRAWHSHLQSTLHEPRSPEWQFVIAGWDQGGHEAELKSLCNELGLSWSDVPASKWMTESSSLITDHCSLGTLPSVAFTGPAFGKEKDTLLRRASAFILPSFSEGLPMSVLEAWAYRLPVLMTDHCNLPEGFAHHAAIRIGTDVASIAEGIQTLFQLPSQPPTKHQEPRTKHTGLSDLQSLGMNGRALVERQFTWPQVARQLKEVYQWVLGQGPKPDCVRD
jgi:poly(glycerol-phosphate) alpha-glucosyltransferase